MGSTIFAIIIEYQHKMGYLCTSLLLKKACMPGRNIDNFYNIWSYRLVLSLSITEISIIQSGAPTSIGSFLVQQFNSMTFRSVLFLCCWKSSETRRFARWLVLLKQILLPLHPFTIDADILTLADIFKISSFAAISLRVFFWSMTKAG